MRLGIFNYLTVKPKSSPKSKSQIQVLNQINCLFFGIKFPILKLFCDGKAGSNNDRCFHWFCNIGGRPLIGGLALTVTKFNWLSKNNLRFVMKYVM